MAAGADFHLHVAAGRPGLDNVAATAGDGYLFIFWVYAVLHGDPLFYRMVIIAYLTHYMNTSDEWFNIIFKNN